MTSASYIRWDRTILHADMDAFYAAVEQLDDPSLRGRPVLIGPRSARGVVLTASYEARPYGVGSAMPMVQARRLCPQALVVPPRFERYQAVSRLLMSVFSQFSPSVEPLSLDEAFLDMTGAERIFGAPAELGTRLKEAVRDATGGLTVSVGISATKYVAKVASGIGKPDGLTIVPAEQARRWLAPLPVDRLWGAGARTTTALQGLGMTTIGDVAACAPERLARALGQLGLQLHALARAQDGRAVDGTHTPRSIGSELTLAADTAALEDVRFHLRRCAEKVARRLRRTGYRARGLRVKLKRHDFRLLTRQRRLPVATDVSADLREAAESLLPAFGELPPVRLIGIAAYDLEATVRSAQQELLAGGGRARALDCALDKISDRFGQGVVTRASELMRDTGIGAGSDLDFLRPRVGSPDR